MKRALAALAATGCLATAFAQDVTADEAPSADLWAQERAREDAGDFDGAIHACMQILRRHPKEPRAMNAIAGLNGKLGRYRDEITWASRAIHVDRGFFEAQINLGTAEAALGNEAAARKAFQRARDLAPSSPMPVYSLGVLAERRHDVPTATALYERAVALDPTFESGWFNLAAMQAQAGRFDDALASLDKVLALHPDAQDAQAMRRHVQADKAAAAGR